MAPRDPKGNEEMSEKAETVKREPIVHTARGEPPPGMVFSKANRHERKKTSADPRR